MSDGAKSKEELLNEIGALRERIAKLESSGAARDAGIERKLEFEKTISAISTGFLSSQNIDEAIDSALHVIGQFSGADRAYLFLMETGASVSMRNSHEWCAAGVPPVKDGFQKVQLAAAQWGTSRLMNGEAIFISDVAALPPEAAFEKQLLESAGIKSMIAVPVSVGRELAGAIGFESTSEAGKWTAGDEAFLGIAAEIIGSAIAHNKAEKSVRDSELRLSTFIDAMTDIVYLKDESHRYVMINKALEEFFGKPAAEIIGQTDFDLMPRDAAEFCRNTDAKAIEVNDLVVNEETIDSSIFETRKFPLVMNGKTCIGGIIRDITSRRVTENVLRNAVERLQKRRLETLTLQKCTRSVLEMNNLKDSIRYIYVCCKELLGAQVGFVDFISEIDAKHGALITDDAECICAPGQSLAMPEGGPRLEAINSGMPVYVNDFAASASDVALPPGHPHLENVLFSPLIVKGKPVGLMGLGNKPGGFNEHDANLALTFCEIAAIAFDNNLMLENLINSENKFRNLFDSSPIGISIPRNLIFLYVNDAFLKLFGYETPDALVGKTIAETISPEHQHHVCEISRRREEGDDVPSTYESVGIRKDGTLFPFHVVVSRMELEDGEATVAFFRDITELKRADEALRDSEARYRAVIEGLPVLLCRFLPDGTLTFVNDAYCKYFAMERGDLIGSAFIPLIHDEDRAYVSAQFKSIGPDNPMVTCEHRVIAPSGEVRWQRWISQALFRNGVLIEYQAIGEDITEQKMIADERESLQRQLVQVQKMEAIGTLAGGIAHDFNNMLTVILGNIQVSLFGMSPDNSLYVSFKDIESAALRARDLTMKLLTFARKEKINTSIVSANVIVEEVKSILERGISKKISIRPVLERRLAPVNVDMNQIHQALLNICNNAADAMPDGGTLTIETMTANLDEAYCETRSDAKPGPFCLIRVRDTGTGIPPEIMDKIFEPFFTTKPIGKGTGLGLSITYGIIKNHGGHIDVGSEPGKGTTVDVYIPFTSLDGTPLETKPASQVKRGSETVLVVDDEELVLSLAEKLLKAAGYKVLKADLGKKALRIYKSHWKEISLVIIDMIMPGMDGLELFEELKKINPGIKAIAASGYSMDGRAGKLLQSGAADFVQKPFEMEVLCNAVRRTLDKTN